MTRYVLLLVGGALVVSALSLLGDRSSLDSASTDASNVVLNSSDPVGVFLPNLGNAPVDAFFYMVADPSVVLLKSKEIAVVRAETDQPDMNLYFIGANGAARVTGITSTDGFSGFQKARYDGLYEGVDLLLSADKDAIAATLTLAPGANAEMVHFKLDRLGNAAFVPSAYQLIDGARQPVDAQFVDGLFGSTKLDLGKVVPNAPVHVGFEISL
jgi:hypothetical protein